MVAADDDETAEITMDHDLEIDVITPNEILWYGLELVGYTTSRLKRARLKRNIERFKCHYGATHVVCAMIWEDLQLTPHLEARVAPVDLCIDYFLMAMHALKKYPTENEREPIFDISPEPGRNWCWFYLKKIQALKVQNIVWVDYADGDVWILSVDGQDCWIEEPQHPTWSIDTGYWSHKYNKAGVSYELAIALSESRLLWMNGPFPAGTGDRNIFRLKGGLQSKLKAIKKKGIGDSGYVGDDDELSTQNPAYDCKVVRKFKSRALKRHEKFNGMMKEFECLKGRFRHSVDQFKTCFEAVAVVCQYKIETESPLWDILVVGM